MSAIGWDLGGSELDPVNAIVTSREHPAHGSFDFALVGQDSKQAVFPIVVDVTEVLVLHRGLPIDNPCANALFTHPLSREGDLPPAVLEPGEGRAFARAEENVRPHRAGFAALTGQEPRVPCTTNYATSIA